MDRKISSVLISVFHKDGLEPLVAKFKSLGITIYSTGGTQAFIEKLGAEVKSIESVTDYPSILGGRVKTLHPKVFGGILYRRDLDQDLREVKEFQIPAIDAVIVDLYPFEETVASGGTHQEIIEKIDIGGISLIRAAAKNYKDTLIVSDRNQYAELLELLDSNDGVISEESRRSFAARAFATSSHYDTSIYAYMKGEETGELRISEQKATPLRYGENPHQTGVFYGDLDRYFEKLNGKELSYNNLLDLEAAVRLVGDFSAEEKVCAILKHNNACGIATADSLEIAYSLALEADPLSAFGGVIITNQLVDQASAAKMNELFFEILVAPGFDPAALDLLKSKKNRIILHQKADIRQDTEVRSLLGGMLFQSRDNKIDEEEDLDTRTKREPDPEEIADLIFASKVCKHSKSNTIVLAKNGRMVASGVGETSRVDALKHTIEKANHFGLDLQGAVMASDAFFPFPDCVEIAEAAGICAVIQPGGSIKDQLSIDFCDEHDMAMVFTGFRHFKH